MFVLVMTVRVMAIVAIGMFFVHLHGTLMARFRGMFGPWEQWTAGLFLAMAAAFSMVTSRLIFDGLLFDGKLALLAVGEVFFGAPAAALIAAAELVVMGAFGELNSLYPLLVLVTAWLIAAGFRKHLERTERAKLHWSMVLLGFLLVAEGLFWGYLLGDATVLAESTPVGMLMMAVLIPVITAMIGSILQMEEARLAKEEALIQAKEDLTAQNEEITALYEEMSAAEETLQEQFDQLQQHREEILRHNERYNLLYQAGNEGLWEYDYMTDTTTLSDRLTEIYGYGPEGKAYMTVNRDALIHPDDLPRVYENWRSLNRGLIETYDMEYRILHACGEYRWIRAKGTILRDAEGRNLLMAGSHGDIHLRKTQEERLYESAYTDSLTGLRNRRWFMERLDGSIEDIVGTHGVGAALLLGLDDFKSINEAMGMRSGDEILRIIAGRLLTLDDEALYAARLGGDEFILMLEGVTQRYEIEAAARRILTAISSPIAFNSHEIQVTGSIGVVLIPKDAAVTDAVLRNCDLALTQAKQSGRNTCVFFDERMAKQSMMNLQLDAGLKTAAENNEFSLHYQPIYNIQKERLVGFEALIRWNSPEFGSVSPDSFIRIAEKNGQIVEIGHWVLGEACGFVGRFPPGADGDLYVSVNVSTVQIMQKDFILQMQAVIEQWDIRPERIVMEITETTLMESFEVSSSKIEAMKAWGVRFSLDDFGTGYSSLNYLRKLQVSTLKLDKRFIDELLWDERQRKIVHTMIEISHELGMTVVAEGVEDADQLEVLKQMGCDCVQGYHVSRPVLEAEAMKWVES